VLIVYIIVVWSQLLAENNCLFFVLLLFVLFAVLYVVIAYGLVRFSSRCEIQYVMREDFVVHSSIYLSEYLLK